MNRRIYFDMDGVLADFDAAATAMEKTTGFSRKSDGFWNIVNDIADIFYASLKPIDEMKDFVYELKRQNYNINIISKVPYSCRTSAMIGKTQWIQKWYRQNVFKDVIFIPTQNNKHYYCQGFDILIDDNISICNDWNIAGGDAFLYKKGEIAALKEKFYSVINNYVSVNYIYQEA